MRVIGMVLTLAFVLTPLRAQVEAPGPSDPKAQKSFRQAMESLRRHDQLSALDGFKHADKQDGGHCVGCQEQIVKCAVAIEDWKAAEAAAVALVSEAQNPRDVAVSHFTLGIVLMDEGRARHKQEFYARAHDEMVKSLTAKPDFALAVYNDGIALAHVNQDAAAKAQFERYIAMVPPTDQHRARVLRFIREPEMARAKLAPSFAVTTVDGQHVALDDFHGKVVLLDFWATWCGACREALPHMQAIAKKFQGQPLVIVSVSLDSDDSKWRQFIAKNGMTWLNCRDGGFEGGLAKLFEVHEIPHTFTIDAEGVLQNESIGDTSIESKLKKLVAHAVETSTPDVTAQPPVGIAPPDGK